MTTMSGSITIESRKLEEAVAEAVTFQVAKVISEAVRPIQEEVRRLATLAEAQMVGAAEAAKILVSAGATVGVHEAGLVIAQLARMGYRFTLVDPNADTQEVPVVTARDNGFAARPTPWTEGAKHPETCSCVHCAVGVDPLIDPDTSWTAKFE